MSQYLKPISLCWIVFAFAVGQLSAEVIVVDDFMYNQPTKELGTLGGFTQQNYAGGQNGAAGTWTGQWISSGEAVITGPDFAEPDDHFTAIVGDLGIPVNFNYLRRPFDTAGLAADQTIYFAVETRVDIDALNLPRIWLNAPPVDEFGEEDQISMGFQDGGFIAELGTDFTDNIDEITNDGEFHRLVGKLEINAAGDNERLSVWLNPTGPETGDSAIVEENVIDSIADLDGTLQLGRMDTQCCGVSGLTYWDNVAVGTTWEDVTQVEVPRLTLQVDPDSGSMALTNNTSEPFDIKFYEIESASGSLRADQWNSLADQGVSGGGWLENNPGGEQLIESNFAGETALSAGQSFGLGAPFDPNGSQDLVARVATSDGLLNLALVEYGPIAGLPGDFNMNGVLDSPDIDDLTGQVAGGTNPPAYDLNNDSLVNQSDINVWIKDLFNSWIGDANLDGEFNSGDLVVVLASGTYEVDQDSEWSTGDFNGDARTNTGDLVLALADGGYEAGPRMSVAAVPEPSSIILVSLAGLLAVLRQRQR